MQTSKWSKAKEARSMIDGFPLSFFLAVIGYGLALCGYGARRFRQEPRVRYMLGKQWVVVHIVGMIGSYVVLWTAFFVDNAHRIPGLNQLPSLTFWVLPTVIGIPFIVLSISRFVPNIAVPSRRPRMERKPGGRQASSPRGIVLRSRLGKGGNTNDRSDSTNGIAHLCCIDPDPWNPVLDRPCSR